MVKIYLEFFRKWQTLVLKNSIIDPKNIFSSGMEIACLQWANYFSLQSQQGP